MVQEAQIFPCRVLLVEDDDANLMVAETLLQIFGYDVDVARNGAEAVEKAKTGRYAIAIMDMRMQLLDGLEATRRIRRHERKTGATPLQIIAVTANALVGEAEHCRAAGMDDYLAKPYRAPELQHKLATLRHKAALARNAQGRGVEWGQAETA